MQCRFLQLGNTSADWPKADDDGNGVTVQTVACVGVCGWVGGGGCVCACAHTTISYNA